MFASARDDDHAERELIARIRLGDPRAFAILVDRYIESVTHFACAITGSRDVADDVVQIVFVHVWEQRATLDPARPIKPYLFRAVRNRALDDRKANAVRAHYRERVQAEAASGIIPPAVPSFESDVLCETMMQEALGQLPERRQLALRLRIEQQLSLEEIGQALDISAEAAKKLVNRALKELRQILGVSP